MNATPIDKQADRLRFGVVGLGVGASSILPPLQQSPFSALCAGSDINPVVRQRFQDAFPAARVYETIEGLCEDDGLDAIWISTPNKFHADHAVLAARHGKHVVISKPMATSLAEAGRIIDACDRYGVKLVVGHSLGFSPAIREMARLTRSAETFGQVRAVQMMAFTDWMLLPRTAEEVDAAQGGGLIHRQSPHQIDAARLLCGGMVDSVRASAGRWMQERKAPGFFAAFLQFENEAVATISHNGYGYLVLPDVVSGGRDAGIAGHDIAYRNDVRRAIRAGSIDEEALKDSMRMGGAAPLFRNETERKAWMPLHLGLSVVTCERADLRHSPYGVYVYDGNGRSEYPVDDDGSWFGLSEIEELYRASRQGVEPYRDGRWGMATLEVAMAIQESSDSRKDIRLRHQVRVRPGAVSQAYEMNAVDERSRG